MLVLLACTPVLYADPWTHTHALCGAVPWVDPPDPDPTCRAALLADIHADDDHSPATDGLARGLHWLAGADLGADVAPDPWLPPEYADTLDAVRFALPGDAANNQALYDLVVDRTEDVRIDRDGLVAMGWDGTLYVADYLGDAEPAYAAATLVHEARHRDGPAWNHVPCLDAAPDDPAACDDTDAGAHAFAVATLTLALRAEASWDAPCPAQDDADAERERILRRRQDIWLGRILTPPPPDDRPICG